MTDPDALHEAALTAGATQLGDPPHYIFSEEELARFALLVGLVPPPLEPLAGIIPVVPPPPY